MVEDRQEHSTELGVLPPVTYANATIFEGDQWRGAKYA